MASIRTLTSEEEKLLQLLIEDKDSANKKLGLKVLCDFYQAKRRLKNSHAIVQSVNGLLFDRDTEIERWALKAITEIRDRRSLNVLIARIRNPSKDYENQTW